ncbi:ACT domain-containing protein [Patescibacteria group bacterium]|nr:ACT domain-containing protein [Patescibacteria group bacterium]
MNRELAEIIKNSTFTVAAGRFVYIKAASLPTGGGHFMVTQDQDEITVVTQEDNLSQVDFIEKNKDFYKLIALNVSVPFYCVGFLEAISEGISAAGLNILIISTYSKDYIMVKDDCWFQARKVLLKLGFQEQ